MKQIFAEGTFGNCRQQIACARGNHAHVDMNACRAADASEVLVDENTQDFRLRFLRHVGDFVNVERAAMRLFQCADFAALPIHGLGAEKFDFHRLGRDRRCVDDVERTAGAV